MSVAMAQWALGIDTVADQLLELLRFRKALCGLARKNGLAVESHLEYSACARNQTDAVQV